MNGLELNPLDKSHTHNPLEGRSFSIWAASKGAIEQQA